MLDGIEKGRCHNRIYKNEYMLLCVNFYVRYFICTHVKKMVPPSKKKLNI